MGDETDHDVVDDWWDRTFAERVAAAEQVYGRSHPPGAPQGHVTLFTWDGVDIPGGCCLNCPPRADRDSWAYVGIGLTQPRDAAHAKHLSRASRRGTGYHAELGMLVPGAHAGWPMQLIRQLMWYVRARRPISAGSLLPCGIERDAAGHFEANIGDQAGEGRPLAGPMRMLLLWEHLAADSKFRTSTGPFSVLIATTITGPEAAFARGLTNEHLLLLLRRAGVGQCGFIDRDDVVTSHRWGEDVRLVESMTWEQADAALRAVDVDG